MTTTRTLRMALFDEPLELIKEQPHQLLISTMSIGLMAGFASSNGIIHPVLGIVVAIGIEWAWLRGVTSDTKQPSAWGAALNYSAFVLAALWGTLWVAESLNAYDPKTWGWGMAIIHVVPLVWLSLCSTMSHRAMVQAEAVQAKIRHDAEEQLRLERLAKEQELAIWEQGQRIKIALEDDKKRRDAERKQARIPMRRDARPERINAEVQNCPKCGAFIENRSQWLAAKRWNRCAECKEN